MYSDQDMTIRAAEKAHWMAVTTICDIHKEAGDEALTSTELDDVHHCMEIMKDCYAVKELHATYMLAKQSECTCKH